MPITTRMTSTVVVLHRLDEESRSTELESIVDRGTRIAVGLPAAPAGSTA